MLGIVCGMRAEADLARGPGRRVAIAAGGFQLAEQAIAELVGTGISGIVSFGTAGALAPDLVSGDIVLGTRIVDETGASWPVNNRYLERLAQAIPGARQGLVLGVDRPLLSIADKASALAASGALAADMESHLAARAAAQHGLPLGAVRVILDDSRMEVPAALGDAIDGKGSARPWIVAVALFTGKVRIGELLVLRRGLVRAKAALLGGGAALASLGD